MMELLLAAFAGVGGFDLSRCIDGDWLARADPLAVKKLVSFDEELRRDRLDDGGVTNSLDS
jgi:hypothetical protein